MSITLLFEDLAHRLHVSPWLLMKATVPSHLVPIVHFMGVLLSWIKMEEQSSLFVALGFFFFLHLVLEATGICSL